jgi:hypothetical protein
MDANGRERGVEREEQATDGSWLIDVRDWRERTAVVTPALAGVKAAGFGSVQPHRP